MKSLAMPGRSGDKFFSPRDADFLTWAGLLVFLFAIIQLVSVGEFKKDFLMGIFNFHLSEADRAEIMWTMGKVALIALIIATGQYARALIAVYAIVLLFGSYGSVFWVGDNRGKDLTEFSFSDLPNVTVTRGSATNQVNTNLVRTAAEQSGLKNCGAMTPIMMQWCDTPYKHNPAILSRNSSDIAKLRCETGTLYKKQCP